MDKKINNETLSVNDLEKNYKTNLNDGLSNDEAKIRLENYGKNELKEKKRKSFFAIFLSKLNDPLIYILFCACFFTIGISIYETIKTYKNGLPFDFFQTGDWPDVIIILLVIIINGVISTIQEVKAETSLKALKALSSPESNVIRQGKNLKVKSNELVVGDLILLEEGDTVGADIRLIESYNLKANESSLTGESVPVLKDATITFNNEVALGDRVNMVFMATTITYGRGKGIVVNTAMNTEIGKIASSISKNEKEETPLQKSLAKLSKFLGILTLSIVFLMFIINIIWIIASKNNLSIETYIEAILTAISLAVAAVPEGLSAVVTIVLSLGVQKMVKVNTIVRKLPSIEALGSVNVVCSDKTGTLTQNKMTIKKAYINFEDINENEFESLNEKLNFLAKGMCLCSNASIENGQYGDPTEIALLEFANKLGLKKEKLEIESPRIDEIPFDSIRKMMSTMHLQDGEKITYTKGALESILPLCNKILINNEIRNITNEDKEKILKINQYYSSKALRVLTLAYSTNTILKENNLIFVGLLAMIDPARKEALPAVRKLKEAGIKTIMITGDHKDTAFAIAKELEICADISECYLGSDVDKMSFEELKQVCLTAKVFARVSPENKVQIVNAFKANNNVVAMTGDGVNDAPSLKASNVGIAMGISGTDVAKSAADIILTDDNFASIEKAIEEGRGMYVNIKKTVIFLLSANITEVLAMFILIALGFPSPFIAIHLLWINLITDSLPAISLGILSKDKDIMKNPPRKKNESLFSNGGIANIIVYSIILTIGVLIAYVTPAFLQGKFTYNEIKELYANKDIYLHAQTMSFTVLALSELIHMFNMASFNYYVKNVIFKKENIMLFVSFFVGLFLQLIVIEVPAFRNFFSTKNLTTVEWIITFVLSMLPLLIHELIILFKKKIVKK